MNNVLQVFSYKAQDVRTITFDGEAWFVAVDVCKVLELSNPTVAIEGLDEDERAKFFLGRQGEANIINESGLYGLIFRSNKPEAKEFSKWVRSEVLPSIRRTGSYSLTPTRITQEEIALRQRELDVRSAEILQRMLNNPPFPVTPETQTVFAHEVFRLTAGHSYLAMLPDCTEKWYTATEIGAILGISANKVGRIAKANGLKAPEGESNEYGRWIYSKSQHSSREVPSYIYNENALEWLRQYQSENA